MFSRHALALVLLILLAALAVAQKPTVKQVPCSETSPASGQEMYVAYCASCHGTDGRGGGPVVAALKTPPPDLTMLTRRSNGNFPAARVYHVIRGDENIFPAHGNKDMPVWGRVFLEMSHTHPSEVHQRITNLTEYIESLQKN